MEGAFVPRGGTLAAPATMKRHAWIFFVLAACAGAAGTLLATARGPDTYGDGYYYVLTARRMNQGLGYTVPGPEGQAVAMRQWPPLYPALLSLGSALGLDVLDAGRAVNAASFAAVVLLAGLCLRGRVRPGVAAGAALLMVASQANWPIWVACYTEPLFLALLLGSLVLLGRRLDGGAWWTVALSALLAGAAFLTRFATFPWIALAGLALLLNGRATWRRRLAEGVLYGLVACLPVALWTLHLHLTDGPAANRPLVFHPPERIHLEQARDTLLAWLVPPRLTGRWQAAALAILAAGVVLLGGLFWRSRVQRPDQETPAGSFRRADVRLLGGWVLAHLLFTLFSITFLDVGIRLAVRTFFPIYVPVVVLLALAAEWALRRAHGRAFSRTAAAVSAGYLMVAVLCAGEWVWQSARGGVGYFRDHHVRSAVLQHIRTLPPEVRVYTNDIGALYFLAGRTGIFLPLRFRPETRKADPAEASLLERMREDLRTGRGVVAYFDNCNLPHMMNLDDLRHRLPLREVLHREDDGGIYCGQPAGGR